MYQNYWLGSNELVIVFRDGTHHIIEEFENWETVFTGNYEQCTEYCDNRVILYQESIIG